MRIVICDAHQVFADALAALLRAADHRVIGSAHDLGEVTGILERDDADVCVTDLRCLPPEHQRIEQAIDAFSGTAFVAVSTSADPASLRQALAAGFRGLSLKNDDFDEILRVLTTAAGEPAQSSDEFGEFREFREFRATRADGIVGVRAGCSQAWRPPRRRPGPLPHPARAGGARPPGPRREHADHSPRYGRASLHRTYPRGQRDDQARHPLAAGAHCLCGAGRTSGSSRRGTGPGGRR